MYEHFTRQQQQFNVRRGDVYYINNNRGQRGNEIRKDRPAVVVSADFLNKHSGDVVVVFVQEVSGDVVVVFLTSQPKKDMSTHVTIRTTGRVSEALCEQPTTVSVERLNNRIGSVTDREMQQIDIALQIALKLDAGADTKGYVENQSGGGIA
jgi:mRNA interferase MazF